MDYFLVGGKLDKIKEKVLKGFISRAWKSGEFNLISEAIDLTIKKC